MAGIMVCGYNWPTEECLDITVKNNIVAGSTFAGIGAFATKCGDYNDHSHKNNIVHSTAGNAFIIYPNPNKVADHLTCYEVSSLIAYKNAGPGVISYFTGA